ncbi:MAG: hypothetical protein PHQ40_01960 [Anaerolineaceae bacterium]|nr:hypothetical protein [Anaerolineaceae bacterium]
MLKLSPSLVQAYVGHVTPWLTLEFYSHTTAAMEAETVGSMDQLLA